MKQLSITLLVVLIAYNGLAQRKTTLDTTKPTTVVVTSSFKPVLRPAAKINFSAATPAADTAKPRLFYTIPSQNLFFTYQPTPLQPLALSIDTSFRWQNQNYVKAGYGNYTTPYLRLGLSFGDGQKSIMNFHARHVSSKGQLAYQKFSYTNLLGIGIFNSNNKNEWTAKVYADLMNQYLYGYQPDSLKLNKDSLMQNFNSFGGRLGLRNKNENAIINYDPSVRIEIFNDNKSGNESTLLFDLPVSKNFGQIFGLSVGLHGAITALKLPNQKIDNNLYWLDPAFQFKTPNFKVNAGFTPSWDNSIFNLLPNFSAEAKLRDERFVIQAGWIGYYNRNTYKNLATYNPFIAQPQFSSNTKTVEQYAGFKGSAGNHFTYNARISYLKYSNAALFANDTIDGKTFVVLNEPSIKDVRIHGEVGYTVQEKFSFLAGVTFNQYSNLSVYEKAYGLLPMEFTGSLRWHILKDLSFTSDVYFWDGAQYLSGGKSFKQKAAVDVNAGLELGITPKLSGWLQFNNIFNNQYQRWNNYKVLGFNVLGGIVYSFGQTAKK
jgi:hypothetical protein